MLNTIDEERMEKLPKIRKHRTGSNSPPRKKRTDSIKLTQEEIKYRRYIHNIEREV